MTTHADRDASEKPAPVAPESGVQQTVEGLLGAMTIGRIADAEALDQSLCEMNEAGIQPIIPFVDADGDPNIALGTAPSGDDWVVQFLVTDPDSGSPHCCTCHWPEKCDAGAGWEPTYPLAALIVAKARR